MLNKFQEIFGAPENTVIGYGHWAENCYSHNMKRNAPTKGIRIRKLLERRVYKVLLVNEFRTSCMCSNGCGVESQRKMAKIKDGSVNVVIGEHRYCELYSLFKCTICNNMWNRNVNSSLNIYDIVFTSLHGEPRPIYLTRELKLKDEKKNKKKTDLISQI